MEHYVGLDVSPVPRMLHFDISPEILRGMSSFRIFRPKPAPAKLIR
jgi:hypothetical protein